MYIVFWNATGIIVEFIERGKIITFEVNCESLKKIETIQSSAKTKSFEPFQKQTWLHLLKEMT